MHKKVCIVYIRVSYWAGECTDVYVVTRVRECIYMFNFLLVDVLISV